MYIKNIEFINYRNYQRLELDLKDGVNLIVGENAQGKTNLLEGIYVTSMGKSFRTFNDKELIKFNENSLKIKVDYYRDWDQSIEVCIDDCGNREAKLNGVSLEKRSDIFNNLVTIVFSPEDLRMVKDDPEKRREFINRELCRLKLSYYRNLMAYNKLLRQRNAYLKGEDIDMYFLQVLDEKIVEYGSRLMKDRLIFIDELNQISGKIHSDITQGREKLNIKYIPSIDILEDEDSIEEISKKYTTVMELMKDRDLKRGNTFAGPHRDDVYMEINGLSVKKFGSQGQQRTAALSLKLAEIHLVKAETDENPILLLDDVLSELDDSRQRYLIDSMKDLQIIITTAELNENLREISDNGNIIGVRDGSIC